MSVLLIPLKGLNLIEILRLEQTRNIIILHKTKIYIDYDNILSVSSNTSNVLKEVCLIDDETVLSVQPMRDSLLRVNHIDDSISV